MSQTKIQINTLGVFSIEWNGEAIDDSMNRSRKVWLLLAYMIHNRNVFSSQANIVRALWDDGEKSVDPQNALKTTLHRARTLLDKLGDDSGHKLILRKSGSYMWNTEFDVQVDAEYFEELYKQGVEEEDVEKKLNLFIQALNLYKGDFLEKLSMESWVIPLSVYYRKIYVEMALSSLATLKEMGRNQDIIELGGKILTIESFNEDVYRYYMNAMIAVGDRAGVIATYESLKELMFATFGVMPAEDIRKLYFDALSIDNKTAISIEHLSEQLAEPTPRRGAFFCEYDFFRILYQSEARQLFRRGECVHIAMLTIDSRTKKELSKRSVNLAMDNLQEVICSCLRAGDAVAKCSPTQFVIMLPQANFENSNMVCERVRKSFFREYPHSPVQITYAVKPVAPLDGFR